MLHRAAQTGSVVRHLEGKHVGLLCEADTADAQAFRQAAQELGATVAHIKPGLSESSSPLEVQQTARTLGLLYDAVECQGIAAALVQMVAEHAGVPVYDGLASTKHATAHLAGLVDSTESAAANRRFVVQAVLLCNIV
jgi:ornithine carbamoyltransferase